MPTTPVYPLDVSGLSITNLSTDELITLSTRPKRAACPSHGAFFTESIIVKDNDNNRVLVRGVDYTCVQILKDASANYGKEIALGIIVINQNVATVSHQVKITCQYLGGGFQDDTTALINALENIVNQAGPVNWLDIVNKPNEYNPSLHNHLLNQVYGWESLVSAFEKLGGAITIGNAPMIQHVIEWLYTQLNNLNAAVVSAALNGAMFASRSRNVFTSDFSIDTTMIGGWGEIRTADIVLTLPDPTTVPVSSTYTILFHEDGVVNSGIYNFTGVDGNEVASFSGKKGERVTFISNLNDSWYIAIAGHSLSTSDKRYIQNTATVTTDWNLVITGGLYQSNIPGSPGATHAPDDTHVWIGLVEQDLNGNVFQKLSAFSTTSGILNYERYYDHSTTTWSGWVFIASSLSDLDTRYNKRTEGLKFKNNIAGIVLNNQTINVVTGGYKEITFNPAWFGGWGVLNYNSSFGTSVSGNTSIVNGITLNTPIIIPTLSLVLPNPNSVELGSTFKLSSYAGYLRLKTSGNHVFKADNYSSNKYDVIQGEVLTVVANGDHYYIVDNFIKNPFSNHTGTDNASGVTLDGHDLAVNNSNSLNQFYYNGYNRTLRIERDYYTQDYNLGGVNSDKSSRFIGWFGETLPSSGAELSHKIIGQVAVARSTFNYRGKLDFYVPPYNYYRMSWYTGVAGYVSGYVERTNVYW